MAALAVAAFALSGCIAAAVVPFAAAGVIGKVQRDRSRDDDDVELAASKPVPMPSARSGTASTPAATPTPTAAPVEMRALSVPAPAAPTPSPEPADSAQPVVLTGLTRLPPPSGSSRPVPPPASPPAPATEPESGLTILPLTELPPPTGAVGPADERATRATGHGWRSLLRRVASSISERPAEDAFGAPGCAKRPPAVVIDAGVAEESAQEREVAFRVLDSLRTLEVAIVFAGPEDAAPALARAGFGEMTQGLTLVSPARNSGATRPCWRRASRAGTTAGICSPVPAKTRSR